MSKELASRAAASPKQSRTKRGARSVGTVIGELHVDAEIALAQQLDNRLQHIAVLARHAHEVALDRGLHLQLAVLDLLDDLARLLRSDALLQRDLLPHGGPRGGNDGAIGEAL